MESFIEWGYLGLFLASFLGATEIPLSSEIVLSFLILNGYDFKLSLLIATIGNWLGGLSSYYLGRLGRWETLERFFNPSIEFCDLLDPSNWNGVVTIPITRAPSFLAASAITGAAPVPVPPPSPAAMKTKSAPLITAFISSFVI